MNLQKTIASKQRDFANDEDEEKEEEEEEEVCLCLGRVTRTSYPQCGDAGAEPGDSETHKAKSRIFLMEVLNSVESLQTTLTQQGMPENKKHTSQKEK